MTTQRNKEDGMKPLNHGSEEAEKIVVVPQTGSEEEVGGNGATDASTPTVTFPDGGLLAWSQVLMGFLIMFSTWGLINAWGVFQTYYNQSPALDTQFAVSWIGSVQSCLLLLSGGLWGRAMDAGYARSLTIIGSVMIVLSLFFTSLSGQGHAADATSGRSFLVYWQILLSQGFLGGLGMGLTFLTSVGIPATYFLKRRALATGLVTVGASIGGIVYPIMFQRLLDRYDFRWALRIVGFTAMVTLFIACCLIRQRRDLPAKPKAPLIQFKALSDPKYRALVLGMVASFAGCYIPYYYLQSRIQNADVDLKGFRSLYFTSLLNTGGVFGRILPNYIADKVGPIFIHAGCVFIGAVLIFVWPFILTLPGLVIFALVYGFFSGAFISLPPATVGSVTSDMSQFGARLGLAVTLNGLGLLAGPPIAGAIITTGSSYTGAAVFGGVIVLAGSAGLAVAGFVKLASK